MTNTHPGAIQAERAARLAAEQDRREAEAPRPGFFTDRFGRTLLRVPGQEEPVRWEGTWHEDVRFDGRGRPLDPPPVYRSGELLAPDYDAPLHPFVLAKARRLARRPRYSWA